MKKMNLKQMVKSNKENRKWGGGADRETERQNRRQRQREIKMKRKTQAHWLPFHSCFSKAVKLTGRGRENTKAYVLIFSLRAPPGPLKLA